MSNSDFTYEKNSVGNLETYEWDNVWWHKPEEAEHKRVLYIGDSISCAIRRFATQNTNEDIYFDGFGTSKGLDNPYFKEGLKLFAKQQVRRDLILFNNGLHGWHLTEDEYESYYGQMVEYLLKEFEASKIVLLLTTNGIPPETTERINRVAERNKRVLKIAEKYSLPVIDIYSVSTENAHLHTADGVHFIEEGNRLLAQKLVENLNNII